MNILSVVLFFYLCKEKSQHKPLQATFGRG